MNHTRSCIDELLDEIKLYSKSEKQREIFNIKAKSVIPVEIIAKINLMYGDFEIVKKE
jgi:hypothetical protein